MPKRHISLRIFLFALVFPLLVTTPSISAQDSITGSQPNADLSTGLVAYYAFDNGAATDNSGNNNNGTVYGNSQVALGIKGHSLKFGGYYHPGYVVVPNSTSLSFADNFTFSVWFNIQSNTSQDDYGYVSEYGRHFFIGKSGDRSGIILGASRSNRDGLWYPFVHNGGCDETNYGGCGNGWVLMNTQDGLGVNLNEWHMASITYGNGMVRLYLDGIPQAELTAVLFKLNPSMPSRAIYIGEELAGPYSRELWYPFDGMLDEIRIYNRSLSESEVQELYHQDKGSVPMPIVMVHGWNGGLGGIGCTEDHKTLLKTLTEADIYFGPLDELLAKKRPVYYARLVTNPCYTPLFKDNVPYLMEAIDQAKRATGYSKVILVAHSMGGLVSRDYIEGAQYRGDVEALFTIGSPHHGVPHDVLTYIVNDFTTLDDTLLGWGTFCKDRQPGMCEFSITGMEEFNKDHRLNSSVKYYFLSGDAPFYTRNSLGLVTDALFLFQPNDGIVGLSSGKGSSLTNNSGAWLTRYANDENHNIFGHGPFDTPGPLDWPYFGPRWEGLTSTNSKTYTECLKPVLVDGSQTTCTGATSALSTVDTSLAFSRTPWENGTLLPGETATRTVTVDGGLALFTSQWQTGTLSMAVVGPDHQIVDEAYAIANPTVVSYTALANGAAFYLPNALSGVWQMVVQAKTVPPTGTAYNTLAGFATNITLTGGADRPWYSSGATATITASLGGLPVSAWVTATVFAGGITTTLPLSLIGGEQYHGLYTVPAVPGYAAVQLRATGITTASLPFEREVGFDFQISPNSALLNNIYGEAIQPYPGLPSLYKALTITVGVNSGISGTLGLSADLTDSNGNFVAHGLTIRNVVTSTTTLALRFDGDDIFASQRNGPYELTNVLLTDQTSVPLVLAEAQNTYTTTAYPYTVFAAPKTLYLPLIRR